MDHHNQQAAPVYVNGQPQQAAQAGASGSYEQGAPVDNGPGFFGMIFWGIVNLLILIAVIVFLVWGIRKLIALFRK